MANEAEIVGPGETELANGAEIGAGAAEAEGEAPPVLSALGQAAYGAIKAEPVKVIEESHKKNYVKISIYEVAGAYYYGYRLKVDRIIRQKAANINDKPLESAESARIAARAEILNICSHSRFVRGIFEDFTNIMYNQYELF